jgi:hypothetical protein
MTLGSYATTYFTIVFGKQKGYAQIDFGDAPPFFHDGLFQYKREWGMSIRPAMGKGAKVFAAKFSDNNETTKGFLLLNPFIFLEGENLRGLTYLGSEVSLKTEFLTVPGLSSLLVVSAEPESLNLDSSELRKRTLEDSTGQIRPSIRGLLEMCHKRDWVLTELSPRS